MVWLINNLVDMKMLEWVIINLSIILLLVKESLSLRWDIFLVHHLNLVILLLCHLIHQDSMDKKLDMWLLNPKFSKNSKEILKETKMYRIIKGMSIHSKLKLEKIIQHFFKEQEWRELLHILHFYLINHKISINLHR